MKRFVSFLLMLVLLCAALPALAEGQTVTVSTAEELCRLRDEINAGADTQNVTVTLACDIDLGGEEWTPIRNFKGTFDGAGHRIVDLSVTGDGRFAALFAGLNKATVRNLGVEGSVSGSVWVGGITAMGSGHIENCWFKGDVAGDSYVGGIAAAIETGCVVENCYFVGELNAADAAGLIVGYNQGTVRSCYGTGTLPAVGEDLGMTEQCFSCVDSFPAAEELSDAFRDDKKLDRPVLTACDENPKKEVRLNPWFLIGCAAFLCAGVVLISGIANDKKKKAGSK